MSIPDSHHTFRPTRNTLAVVLAGGRGSRLGVMTDWRTKPAVPFAGKFRIIDFTLSNCLNSDIRKACVLTQYKSHSLIQHLIRGWSFAGIERESFLDLVPAQQWKDEDAWYEGTADAVHQTMDIIEGHDPDYVLILAGDHVYTMDYGAMVATHVESGADFTIACNVVPRNEARDFGVMKVDDRGRVTGFVEKPDDPDPYLGDPSKALASMGIYVISRDYLRDQLIRDAADTASSHDFGKDIIPFALAGGHKLQAHTFENPTGGEAYWRDVGTIDAFFQANLEQLSPSPPISLHDSTWPIRSYLPSLPPAHLVGEPESNRIGTTMISGGCIVESSSLTRSMLFSNAVVESGCELDGVLALPGCHIGQGCRLTNVILDNQCTVPKGSVIGENLEEDAKRFTVTPGGVVVVNRDMLGQGGRYMPGVMPR